MVIQPGQEKSRMRRQHTGQTILWVLVVGVLVTGALAVKVQRDNRKLASAYAQIQATLDRVAQERSQLNEELAQARQTLEGQADDLSHLQTRLAQAEQELKRLEGDYAQLRETNTGLSQQLSLAAQEKQALEAKLSSLKELRAAIREVKRKVAQERWEAWLGRIQTQRASDQDRLAQGNRGYLIRDGASTAGSSAKLLIRVLDPQTQ